MLESLKLELQSVVETPDMGAGNRTRVVEEQEILLIAEIFPTFKERSFSASLIYIRSAEIEFVCVAGDSGHQRWGR